ncbi:hypothetical protein C1645_818745 [Glomus cerebriforme]|uniref:Uncharacterized protein n=1 Tax=Glomus cerebriforme TaxID=658196 RepID=A0A397TCF2_9GLOM|nr:hypothetical protein C1645_818745 [Glomus cerebriforme]
MDNDLTDLNVEWIKALRKDISFSIIHNTYQPQKELRIKEYHGKSDLVEKAHDFSNVEESWKDVDLVAYTSSLKIGVSCTNPKFERAFCLFNSYIESNAETNQIRRVIPMDIPTIRLWVAYMLEKFRSRRLFGWRMVDFLRETGMIISIIESIPKPGKNVTSLSQVVKSL